MSILLIGLKHDDLALEFCRYCAEVGTECIFLSDLEDWNITVVLASQPRHSIELRLHHLLSDVTYSDDSFSGVWFRNVPYFDPPPDAEDVTYCHDEVLAALVGYLGWTSKPVLNRPKPIGLRPSNWGGLLVRDHLRHIAGIETCIDALGQHDWLRTVVGDLHSSRVICDIPGYVEGDPIMKTQVHRVALLSSAEPNTVVIHVGNRLLWFLLHRDQPATRISAAGVDESWLSLATRVIACFNEELGLIVLSTGPCPMVLGYVTNPASPLAIEDRLDLYEEMHSYLTEAMGS